MFTLKRLILVLQLRITTLLRTPRAMKGEVDQLHKKISLGLRLGFSELRPRSGVWKDRKRRVEKRNFKTETLQCSVKNWII